MLGKFHNNLFQIVVLLGPVANFMHHPLLESAKVDEKCDGDLTQLFQYGPKEGPSIFRIECSKFLSEQYGDTVGSIQLANLLILMRFFKLFSFIGRS